MSNKNFEIIDSRKKENKGQELEDKINRGLERLKASGFITFVVDYNPQAKDIRKIKYANRKTTFAVNKRELYEGSLSDVCRLLLITKQRKWKRAGYTKDYVFPNRDEQMQDFLAWFMEGHDDVPELDFLENLFQRRKME